MNTSSSNPGKRPTIDEIAAVASGEGGSALEARVQAAAARDPRVASTLSGFLQAVNTMRGDEANEPPAAALAQAKALGARLADRRVASRNPVALLGEMFDRAGAVVLEWFNPEGGLALAGVRDDRGADLLEAVIDAAELTIRAERTPAQDGVVRLVGEVLRSDEMPVKADLAVLDGRGVVIATDSTDSLGMFAVALPEGAREVVVTARAADGAVQPTIVLPLGPRDDRSGSTEPRA
jgi:hypothetical protein